MALPATRRTPRGLVTERPLCSLLTDANIVRNHAARAQEFRVTPHVPAGWTAPAGPLRVTVPARQERAVDVKVTAGAVGTGIVTADVAFGAWKMREWTEALVAAR